MVGKNLRPGGSLGTRIILNISVLMFLATGLFAQSPSFVTNMNRIYVGEGGTASLYLWLSAEPAADVNVGIFRGSGDDSLDIASGYKFTIPKDKWNQPVTVTFSAAEDLDESDGEAHFFIYDADETGIPYLEIIARELDNDGNILVGGTITQDTTWSDTTHDYHITSAITIPAGVSLFITPASRLSKTAANSAPSR